MNAASCTMLELQSESLTRKTRLTGKESMSSPHVAPALLTNTCNVSSRSDNSRTSFSTCSRFCRSAGRDMHVPGPAALSSFAVRSQSLADREDM